MEYDEIQLTKNSYKTADHQNRKFHYILENANKVNILDARQRYGGRQKINEKHASILPKPSSNFGSKLMFYLCSVKGRKRKDL